VKKEGEFNHPPGMIFAGFGTGWQPCIACNGSGVVRAPDYSLAVDAVVRSEEASDFTTADWLRLAVAALDQAGEDYVALRKRVEQAEAEHEEMMRLNGSEVEP